LANTLCTLLVLGGQAQSQPIPLSGPSVSTNDLPEPLGIRRILIPPERVPLELANAKPKLLVQIPRVEFEDYVQQAARAEAFLRNPARLQAATYRAVLQDTSLSGTARWIVYNPAGRSGILRIEPLNLAIRKAIWIAQDSDVVGRSSVASLPG